MTARSTPRTCRGASSSRAIEACPEPHGALREVALFGQVRCQARSRPVVIDCPVDVASHLQEVRSNGGDAMAASQRAIESIEDPESGRTGLQRTQTG